MAARKPDGKGLLMMEAREAKRWLRSYHSSEEAAARLIVFPHAGGSASFYHPLSEALSHSLDVFVVQYPGRQERRSEPGVTDLLELADRIALAVATLPDSGPTAIFGHSMGATVGFEVARRLETMGVSVPVLFASGRRAPTRSRRAGAPRGFSDERLLRELAILGGTDPRALQNGEVLRMILPAMRSDYQAIEAYRFSPRPTPKIGGAVTAFVGENDPSTATDDVAAWADHTSGPFSMRIFPGGHFYLSKQWAALASAVIGDLMDVLPSRP
jgi:surfactin synthase thioesterase subunit